MPSKTAVCEHVARSKYAWLFEQVWGAGSLDCSTGAVDTMYGRVGLAIAAYEGSPEVSPFDSRFDDYWRACLGNGDQGLLDPYGVLTAQELDGLIEFGEYCSPCHASTEPGPGGVPPSSPTSRSTTSAPRATPRTRSTAWTTCTWDSGDSINPLGADWIDYGLGGFLRTRPAWDGMAVLHDGKHKVPTIRNVDKRPGPGFAKAYLHNGLFKSLKPALRGHVPRVAVNRDGRWTGA